MSWIPEWLQITFIGRLNRLRFLVFYIGISLIMCLYTSLLWALNNFSINTYGYPMDQMIWGLPFYALGMLLGLYTVVYTVSLEVRRLHDMEKSGWWALLQLIPIVNFFFFVYLFFWKGDRETNDYGPAPLRYAYYSDYVSVFR